MSASRARRDLSRPKLERRFELSLEDHPGGGHRRHDFRHYEPARCQGRSIKIAWT